MPIDVKAEAQDVVSREGENQVAVVDAQIHLELFSCHEPGQCPLIHLNPCPYGTPPEALDHSGGGFDKGPHLAEGLEPGLSDLQAGRILDGIMLSQQRPALPSLEQEIVIKLAHRDAEPHFHVRQEMVPLIFSGQ
jgi:hypothetical protein